MAFFRRFFSAPVFENEDDARRAGVLSFLLNLHLVVAISTAVLLAAFTTMRPIFPLAALLSTLPVLAMRFLLRRGQVNVAAVLFLGMIFLLIPGITLVSNSSVTSVSATAFQAVTIVMAGLLLSGRGAVVFSACTALLNAAFIFAELNGLYSPYRNLNIVGAWLNQSITYVAIAVLLMMTNRIIKQSFARAQHENEERRQAEDKLRYMESLYRRAIDAAGAVPYYRDLRANVYTYMGEGILQMTGYTAEEMTPDLWDSLEIERYPRGALAGMTYEEADALTEIRNDITWECDYLIRTRDGQTRWVADTAVQGMDARGEFSGVVGILQDITERKQTEALTVKVNFELQRRIQELYVLNAVAQAGASAVSEDELLQATVTALHQSLYTDIVGVGLWDETAGHVYTHPSAHRGVPAGYENLSTRPGEGVIGHVIVTLKPYRVRDTNDPIYKPIDPDIRSELCVPILAGEKFLGVLDIESRQPDAFSDADEKFLFTLAGQLASALERLRAEKRLRDLNSELEQRVAERTAELERANRELESFSYSVSHDLRAPLRAINSYTSILKADFADGLDPEGRAFLDKVIAASLKMTHLIDDLLAFSRTSRLPLKKQPVNMHALALQVVESIAQDASPRQITWVVDDLPPAQADPALIQQVYANLIDNAVKYSRNRNPARIEVSCYQSDGETVYFVRDNGAGFDMKYADKLFGVFQRLHHEDEFEGTGIGLATVQRIIHRHGGRIWVEAQPDQGATFYFTLG